MEELHARHRKEQRDLQSQITQKKKQASKKTRKSVNDECARLESELQDRQCKEVKALDAGGDGAGQANDETLSPEQLADLTLQVDADDVPQASSSPSTSSVFVSASASNPSHHDASATSPSSSTEQQQQQQARKPNRQKARLARRAAEQASLAASAQAEAQNLPDLKAQERERMLEAMAKRKLREIEVRADGHCLYSAVADQLSALEIPLTSPSPSSSSSPPPPSSSAPPGEDPLPAYRIVRAAAARYIHSHPDDFVPFLEEPLEEYVVKVRDTGEWGGQVELLALAATYGVGINVLQDFGRVEKIEAEGGGKAEGPAGTKREMWLGYYKHGFGLGEHYNSLRKVS